MTTRFCRHLEKVFVLSAAAGVNHKLRRNKALDDNPWALRFAAFGGHIFFQ